MAGMSQEPTEDLVAWLRAQLDEDERIARAVRVPHDWHQGPGDDPEWTDAEMVCMWPPEFHTPYEQDKHWRGLRVAGAELAAHIAAHDPARVLREIDAKRRVLNASAADCSTGCGAEHTFSGSCALRWMGPVNEIDGQHLVRGEKGDLVPAPPVTPVHVVRLLALPYSGRPGYREEWRP